MESRRKLASFYSGWSPDAHLGNAQTTVDKEGRFVIAARDFVVKHGIQTVFGMAGSYLSGELAIAIVFTRELMNEQDVDRYTSLISTFKMETDNLPEGTSTLVHLRYAAKREVVGERAGP